MSLDGNTMGAARAHYLPAIRMMGNGLECHCSFSVAWSAALQFGQHLRLSQVKFKVMCCEASHAAACFRALGRGSFSVQRMDGASSARMTCSATLTAWARKQLGESFGRKQLDGKTKHNNGLVVSLVLKDYRQSASKKPLQTQEGCSGLSPPAKGCGAGVTFPSSDLGTHFMAIYLSCDRGLAKLHILGWKLRGAHPRDEKSWAPICFFS